MATWITSDLHLNHNNILSLEAYNLRKNGLGYIDTIDKYNDMIIQRINSVVSPNDTLYILGDAVFGGTDVITSLLSRINGYKILIRGNHDRYGSTMAKKMGFDEAYDHPIYLPEGCGKVILSHYPLKEAFNNPYIVYNIHGHLHNSKLNLPNYLNVNIAMNKYYPIKLDTLISRIASGGKSRRERWLEEWYAEYQVFSAPREDLVLKANGLLDVEKTKEVQEAMKQAKKITKVE